MTKHRLKGWIVLEVPSVPICVVREDRYRYRCELGDRMIVVAPEDVADDVAEIRGLTGFEREYRALELAEQLRGS